MCAPRLKYASSQGFQLPKALISIFIRSGMHLRRYLIGHEPLERNSPPPTGRRVLHYRLIRTGIRAATIWPVVGCVIWKWWCYSVRKWESTMHLRRKQFCAHLSIPIRDSSLVLLRKIASVIVFLLRSWWRCWLNGESRSVGCPGCGQDRYATDRGLIENGQLEE